ncbi:conserved serine-threonine rich protein [Ophiocordyceps camponoti-floridani]|uniref:Conserved serine-threonine rich protein n=1 Tax=Ophiocordyceps camponoti-floridani TaxID=2030778 RepID=A0A8H4Q390_9HYPO|nr:conserved serine-threonine rich protein [Ophiocordyceps camponoti-floridani]
MLAAAATPSSRARLGTMTYRCCGQSTAALTGIAAVASKQCRNFRCRSSPPRASRYWYAETSSRWDRDDMVRDFTTLFRARFFAVNADSEFENRLRQNRFKDERLASLYGLLKDYRSLSQTCASKSAKKSQDHSFIDPITNRRISKNSSKNSPSVNAQTNSSEVKDAHQVKPQYESGTAAEQPSGGYEDLDDYKEPITWKEPDGLPDPPPEDLTKNYDDLDQYGPVKWQEPDGLPEPNAEDKSKNYKDLKEYKAPFVADDAVLSAHEKKQQTAQHNDQAGDYKDLGEYGPTYWHEPDGLMEPSAEDTSKKYNDLRNYKARYGSETPVLNDAAEDSCSTHDAPTKKCRSPPENAAAGVGVSGEGRGFKQAKSKYQDAYNKPGAEPLIRTGLDSGSTTGDAVKAWKSGPVRYPSSGVDAVGKPSTVSYVADIGRRVRHSDESKRIEMQRAKSEYEMKWDAAWMEAQEALSQTKKTEGLTGNYTRDFPEEFAASWSTSHSPSKSTLYPHTTPESNEVAARYEAEASSMDESFPSEDAGKAPKQLEPALNRERKLRQPKGLEAEDAYCMEPQGLETSYAEECGSSPGRPTVKFLEGEGGRVSEWMVVFKIVAYDGETGAVKEMDMDWRAGEKPLPISPAKILPRLSHPSKFLPHISSLHAQGYDLASGGGDVVVLQKLLLDGTQSGESAPGETPRGKGAVEGRWGGGGGGMPCRDRGGEEEEEGGGGSLGDF